MRYWDSSAIMPLLVEEANTKRYELFLREDPYIATWWASKIECASALNRLYRDEALNSKELSQASSDLETLAAGWLEIQATEKLRRRAIRLLRLHALRAADATQLAASLIAADDAPRGLDFVCSDTRLTNAAEKEGFTILS